MGDAHDIISDWIAREIIPHEGSVRRWIARRWGHIVDTDDVLQETYCRIASQISINHIENPRAYFFRAAHSVATNIMRRAGIINFTSMAQIDWSNVMDSEPSADRALEAAQELDRVNNLMAELSDTHRKAIELRRIEGLSRKETADRLGITEDALKKHVERGMRQIVLAMARQDDQLDGGNREAAEPRMDVVGKRSPY